MYMDVLYADFAGAKISHITLCTSLRFAPAGALPSTKNPS